MTKTLALALTLALSGVPSFAAEFAELPAGEPIRVETPLTAAGGLQTANLSVPMAIQPLQTEQGVVISEVSASLKAAAATAQTTRPAAQAKASPRAELAAADHGGAVAFASLADGGKSAAPSAEAVAGAESSGLFLAARYDDGESRATREPRAPERARSAIENAWQWIKGVPDGWKIGVAAAVIIGGTIFGFYEHAKARTEFWEKSRSHHEIVLIDQARRSGDSATLGDIAENVQARQKRMEDRIAAAKASKKGRVDDKTHDKVADARRLAAFDGLVWSRALLNQNFTTDVPSRRLGAETPARWTSEEKELEQDALSTHFEGDLALSLKSLQGEVGREKASAQQIDGQLQTFEKQVPFMFGRKMDGELKKGQADLKEFRDREIAPEDALWTAENGAMRGRVSDRLYSERGDYRGHRDRRDRLTTVFDAKVDPAYKTAKGIDDDLSSMISHKNSEAAYMVMASLHTHDYAGESCDSNGKNCHSVYEDNSGIYRALAASEASAAASDARSANAGLKRLKPMVSALYADKTLSEEQLTGLLPKVEGRQVGEGGFDVFGDLLLHPLFGIFGSLSGASSAESARSSFGPILGSLQALDREVGGRRDGEIRWVEGQISTDLDKQMDEATQRKNPPVPAL